MMRIRAGYNIRFDTQVATPMLAMLSIHPSRNKDLVTPHRLAADPDVEMVEMRHLNHYLVDQPEGLSQVISGLLDLTDRRLGAVPA